MKAFLLAVAMLLSAWPALAWTDDQMLYFSEISYKVGFASGMAEDAKIMHEFGMLSMPTYKTIVEGSNSNIRFYNLLLEKMFNSTIASMKKKSEYAI